MASTDIPAQETGHPDSAKVIAIGTRRSKLAMVQAESIKEMIKAIVPDHDVKIFDMVTLGDKNPGVPLHAIGAKGLWTDELEAMLFAQKIDLIVHCLKDMPTQLPDWCAIGAIPERDDARDALIVKAGLPYTSLDTLPQGAVIGTSSVRRSAQLARLHPHLKFIDIRGNIDTRLAKLDKEDSPYTAIILTSAGLDRVGLTSRITQHLTSANGGMLHAVGQGALALEIRRDDKKITELLSGLSHPPTSLACLAERSLMRALEGGCSVPIGVETKWVGEGENESLELKAIVVSLDGKKCVQADLTGSVRDSDQAEALGKKLADQLVELGVASILDEINATR